MRNHSLALVLRFTETGDDTSPPFIGSYPLVRQGRRHLFPSHSMHAEKKELPRQKSRVASRSAFVRRAVLLYSKAKR